MWQLTTYCHFRPSDAMPLLTFFYIHYVAPPYSTGIIIIASVYGGWVNIPVLLFRHLTQFFELQLLLASGSCAPNRLLGITFNPSCLTPCVEQLGYSKLITKSTHHHTQLVTGAIHHTVNLPNMVAKKHRHHTELLLAIIGANM